MKERQLARCALTDIPGLALSVACTSAHRQRSKRRRFHAHKQPGISWLHKQAAHTYTYIPASRCLSQRAAARARGSAGGRAKLARQQREVDGRRATNEPTLGGETTKSSSGRGSAESKSGYAHSRTHAQLVRVCAYFIMPHGGSSREGASAREECARVRGRPESG